MTHRHWFWFRSGRLILGWLALGATLAEPVRAAEPPVPRGYLCRAAGGPLTIDGALDDPAWASAEWSTDFVDIEGAKKPAPPLRTRVKMLWNRETLFIGAELVEPHVWANLTDHDSIIFFDNDFEIFLDPDSDNHRYFEVEINARNTEWDLFLPKPYRDGGPADNAWEIPGLQKAIRVQGTLNDPSDRDTAWTVELAIPIASLTHAGHRTEVPRVGDQWRINFSRVEWDTVVEGGKYVKVLENGKPRPEHNWVWSPQGVIDMHQPEHWGILQFADATTPTVTPSDPAQPIRDHLMAIYQAAKARQKAGIAWDGNLQQLDPALVTSRSLGASPPKVRTTPDGFEATISEGYIGGPVKLWTVDQTSRLTHRPSAASPNPE